MTKLDAEKLAPFWVSVLMWAVAAMMASPVFLMLILTYSIWG